jgi:hypothetical protein
MKLAPYLAERVRQWIPATVFLREIAERGYDGGISQLKVAGTAETGHARPRYAGAVGSFAPLFQPS